MPSYPPIRVTVIVPTRNRDNFLPQSLASVHANLDAALDVELLVVDNGAGRDTAAIAARFGARYLRSKEGASAARNTGIESATGEYLAFLDDDDEWTGGHLRQQVEWLAARPNFGAVLGQIQNIDFEMQSEGLLWPESLPPDGHVFATLLRTQPQLGATLIRRSALDSIGRFDEALDSDEDWDLHLRLALKHLIGFMPLTCVLFRARPDGTWDDLQWHRIAPFRKVFWTNVHRAGPKAPPRGLVMRSYLHQIGLFHTQLMRGAAAHVSAGRRPAARLALGRAIRVSPLHAAWSLSLDPWTRQVAFDALVPRFKGSPGNSGPEPGRR